MGDQTGEAEVMEDQLVQIKAIMRKHGPVTQRYVDKRLWTIHTQAMDLTLLVTVLNDKMLIAPSGYGSTCQLIAKTPAELDECIDMWKRNR